MVYGWTLMDTSEDENNNERVHNVGNRTINRLRMEHSQYMLMTHRCVLNRRLPAVC